jgi:hypothetical protein
MPTDLPDKMCLLYMWTYQILPKQISIDNGNEIQVLGCGIYNSSLSRLTDAKIKINNSVWAGDVLLNVLISEWVDKGNNDDQNYDNVILHVVWEIDKPGVRVKKPILELKKWVTDVNLCAVKRLINAGNISVNPSPFIKVWEMKRGKDKLLIKAEKEQIERERINADNEIATQTIKSLLSILRSIKKDSGRLAGRIRTIKTIAHTRDRIEFQKETKGYYTLTSKLLLLGDWLQKAGFSYNENVKVIPFQNMLIIIPEKQ